MQESWPSFAHWLFLRNANAEAARKKKQQVLTNAVAAVKNTHISSSIKDKGDIDDLE